MRKAALVAVLAVLLLAPIPSQARAEGPSVSASVAFPGDSFRTPVVIVAGLWQNLRLDGIGDSDPVVVTLHYGYSIPTNGSDSNLYVFSYRAGAFKDDLYGKWLDASNCSMSGGSCIMRISVNVTARENPWTLEVNGSGNLTYSTQISVEAPNPDFGLSSPDFLLRVDPNTPGTYKPEGGQYFRSRTVRSETACRPPISPASRRALKSTIT
jgi:hypothetical protein